MDKKIGVVLIVSLLVLSLVGSVYAFSIGSIFGRTTCASNQVLVNGKCVNVETVDSQKNKCRLPSTLLNVGETFSLSDENGKVYSVTLKGTTSTGSLRADVEVKGSAGIQREVINQNTYLIFNSVGQRGLQVKVSNIVDETGIVNDKATISAEVAFACKPPKTRSWFKVGDSVTIDTSSSFGGDVFYIKLLGTTSTGGGKVDIQVTSEDGFYVREVISQGISYLFDLGLWKMSVTPNQIVDETGIVNDRAYLRIAFE